METNRATAPPNEPAAAGRLRRLRAYVVGQLRDVPLGTRLSILTGVLGLSTTLLVVTPRAAYHAVRDFWTRDRVAFAGLVERLRKEDPEGQEYVVDTLAAFARAHGELRAEARSELARFVRRRTAIRGTRPAGARDACAGLPEAQGVGENVLRALAAIGGLAPTTAAGRLDLTRIDLRGAMLRDSLALRGVDLSGACLAGVQLRGADLTGARLARASLDGASLEGSTLSRAELRGARLRGAQLAGVVIEHADLGNADLTAAALDGATLRHVDLAGASLTCAVLTDATVDDADWTDARLGWAYLEAAHLPAARAWERIATLRGAYLAGVDGLSSEAVARARADGAVLAPLGQLEWRRFRREAYAAEPACGEP